MAGAKEASEMRLTGGSGKGSGMPVEDKSQWKETMRRRRKGDVEIAGRGSDGEARDTGGRSHEAGRQPDEHACIYITVILRFARWPLIGRRPRPTSKNCGIRFQEDFTAVNACGRTAL
jgi:hypothetical protein